MMTSRIVPDPGLHVASLRQMARRAHGVLGRSGDGTDEADGEEIRALLQQVAQLRRYFRTQRPSDLQIWLARVEEKLKSHPLRHARLPEPAEGTARQHA